MSARSQVTKGLLTLAALLTLMAVLSVLTYAADPASANWTKLSPATSPAARVYSTMVYDPVSKKIVLFGGFGQNGMLNDTWTFDGTTWTQQQTAVAPTGRTGSAMAFDKRSQKIVMFGGFNGGQTGSAFLHDTWLWDGATSTWTEVKMKTSPPRGTGAVMFPDPASGDAVMFGGYNPTQKVPNLNKTWHWTGQAWQRLHPATSAYGRGWAIATFDPIRKNVVLTGGNGDTIRTDNTWTWDGKNWAQQSPSTQVQALVSAGIAFDPEMKSTIVFGGFGEGSNQNMNQTWSWDGSNWVQLSPKKSPSVRDGLAMAYDPATHEVVMFGGEVRFQGKLLGDTWKWTGR